jgi:hypothetical protein
MSIDITTGIHDAFKKLESSEAQRQDSVAVLAPLCKMTGDVCTLKATGEAIESDASRKWLADNKPHLLPAPYERSLADRAFADGNFTARNTLTKQIGYAEATRIAQSYGLKSLHDTGRGKPPATGDKPNGKGDHSTNPFHASNWSLAKQGAMLRALGPEKTAAIAASVGCKIGSTRPNAAY